LQEFPQKKLDLELKKMIIVKISGGLGNQLFQYSFGQYLSKVLNTSVLYDLQTEKKIVNYLPRKLGLNSFDIELNIASLNDTKKMKCFNNGILERIERKFAQFLPSLFSTYFVEKTEKIRIKDNCYYDGYWQFYKYQTQDGINFTSFSLSNINTNEVNRQILRLLIEHNSISIHIRRGDYISIKKNSSIFCICNYDYYESAIQYIDNVVEDPIYYIFCDGDDLKWARDNFIGKQFRFVTGNSPIEDLYLMSKCKHNIIANSTFSWWAAWLNKSDHKIVIAPKQWYNGKQNSITTNLVPDTWIRM
jgi:hypothetical protein